MRYSSAILFILTASFVGCDLWAKNLDNWVPSPSCDSKYFDSVQASNPESRCRDILSFSPRGRKIVHYYTCRFKNNYPPDDACGGARISRVGLESYTCEADNPINPKGFHKGCVGNYKMISEWHGDIERDLTEDRPYGFVCRANSVPPICLAPKYEFAYRSGLDHCCVMYKSEKKKPSDEGF